MKFKELSESKIVLIYVYYQRKQEQKNQTNLAFFLKYGLNKENWKHLDITTILVIDRECEVMIPKDVHVIYSNSLYYSDYEGWFDGIKYINTISNVSNYDYLCLINASTFGPVMEEDKESHWLYPFYNKLVETDSFACSPYMNKFEHIHHLVLSTHFVFLKITEELISLLIKKNVFGKKINKIDAIHSGEVELSNVLSPYGVCSLFYKKNEDCFNDFKRREFIDVTNIDLLTKTIFIKNIWRLHDEYVGKPVLYHFCNSFLKQKLNIKDLFELNSNEIDFSRMTITPNYYYEYVYAEEPIVFPKKGTMINKSCAIYIHEGDTLPDYVIKGLKTLVYVGYEVFFYSNASIEPNSLPFPVRSLTTLSTALKEVNGFDWVMYMNSSVLFPIYGIDSFVKTVIEARKADVWCHWDKELPFEFKGSMTDSIRTFLNLYDESKLWLFLKNLGVTCTVVDAFAMKRDQMEYVSPYCNDLTKYLCKDGVITKEESPPTIDIVDWRGYLDLYPDLRKSFILTKEQALNHWLEHGRNEGRIMIQTFAWKEYLDRNPQLKEAGIITKEQAVTHWMIYR